MTGDSRATTPCPSCDNQDPTLRWGHEVHGVYDGILFWSCAACSHLWPRDFGAWVGLQRQADEHVEKLRCTLKTILDGDREAGRAGHGAY